MTKETNGTVQTSNQRGKMAVVTCFFNWAGFHRKTANLRRFLHQMAAQDIPVFGIEAVLPGQQAVTQGFEGWQRVPATERNIMFQKEALLNRAVTLVPAEYTKIAWFDADVWFANSGWFKTAEIMLDTMPVIQLYGDARWLDQSGSVEIEREGIAKWKMHGGSRIKGPVSMAHTGFAWAAQRKLWAEFGGLYDNCITGSGDIYNALAFIGMEPESYPMLATDRQKVSGDFKKWAWRVKEWIGGNIGYVPGTVYHEWHGTRRDRSYVKRHEVCAGINVKGDLTTNEFGLKEWTESAKPEFISTVRQYFIDRREDGTEPQHVAHLPSAMLADQGGASVVVTTHPAYIEFLDRTLAAIDAQTTPFAQKIIVLDGFDTPPFESRAGWTILRSSARNPNASRNLGLAEVVNEWVIFWDGDNTMPEDYHRRMIESRVTGSHKTGFFYPSIDYVDAAGAPIKSLEVPEFDYWLARQRTFVDTSSMWLVTAMRSAGGWSMRQPKYDDYEMALRLTRNGWIGTKSHSRTRITRHPSRRSTVNNNADALWEARTLAIATIWGPENAASVDVLNWYLQSDKPPHTRVYWLDNSGSSEFRKRLELCNASHLRVESVTIIEGGIPFDMTGKTHRALGRHEHVANLYNNLLPRITEDLVCLIEDDNIAPLDGLRKLYEPMMANTAVAGIAGLYRSRSNPKRAAASLDSNAWKSPLIEEVKPEPVRAGMLGGGFTLYGNWALRKILPCRCTVVDGSLRGWDANIGIEMARNGYELLLHGGLPVEHRCAEVMDFLAGKEVPA